jgi:hypothetical protein
MLSRTGKETNINRRQIAIVCAVVVILSVAARWWSTRDDRRARAQAKFGLTVLAKSVTPENYQEYGLKSYDEMTRVTLGAPVDVSYVSDDELTEFGSHMKLHNLITETQSRMYPVMVDGEGRVLIRVSKYPTGWNFDSLGEEDIARNLARLQHRRRGGDPAEVPQLAVDVPSMHLCFAAIGKSTSDESLRLTPLNDSYLVSASGGFDRSKFLTKHPGFASESRNEVDAREVFDALSIEAKERDGLIPSDRPAPPAQPETEKGDKATSPERSPSPKAKDSFPGKVPPVVPLASPPKTGKRKKSKQPDRYPDFRASSQPDPKMEGLKPPDSPPSYMLPSLAGSIEKHTVQPGECLALIANKYYGRQTWKRIYLANLDIISNPNLIQPGWELAIPPKS